MKGKGLRGQCMMDDFGPLYTLSKEEKLDLGNGECSLSSDALLFLPFVNPVRLQLLVIHEVNGLGNLAMMGDCDVQKNGKWSCIYAVGSQEYQMVCTILDIASADVGCLKANLQHMEALSTTEAGSMMFTEA
nr:zinc finger, CCHC-type [Tanacetum cinerariifolium]